MVDLCMPPKLHGWPAFDFAPWEASERTAASLSPTAARSCAGGISRSCSTVLTPAAASAPSVLCPTPRSARTGSGATKARANADGREVCASGLWRPATSFASSLLCAMPAEHLSAPSHHSQMTSIEAHEVRRSKQRNHVGRNRAGRRTAAQPLL